MSNVSTRSAEPSSETGLDRRSLVTAAAVPLVALAAADAAAAPAKTPGKTPDDSGQLFRVVNTPNWTVPGISLGAVIENGRPFFLSGHVPIRADRTYPGPDYKEQFEQCFANLDATLRAGGATFDNVIRLTYYVVDYKQEHIPILNEVRNRYINMDNPPTSMLMGVAALARPQILVEIEAWAVLPPA